LASELDELELSPQQQTIEELDLHALRSGTTWREQGEAKTGYLFRAIAERRSKRLVPALHNPTTNSMTTTAEERLQVAAEYYTELYTPDPSDRDATLQLLDSLPATSLLSPLDKERMTARITETELEAIIAKTPSLGPQDRMDYLMSYIATSSKPLDPPPPSQHIERRLTGINPTSVLATHSHDPTLQERRSLTAVQLAPTIAH
jgi:hypothetical protein